MFDDYEPDNNEKQLWREATHQVKPLRNKTRALVTKNSHTVVSSPAHFIPIDEPALPVSTAFSSLPLLYCGKVCNIDKKTARSCLQGTLPIQASLDLHGYHQEQAWRLFKHFIIENFQKQRRLVLIITGKGQSPQGGVLQKAFPEWINHASLRPAILFFCHAQPKDGGRGAFYVLLKRHRPHL